MQDFNCCGSLIKKRETLINLKQNLFGMAGQMKEELHKLMHIYHNHINHIPTTKHVVQTLTS